MSNTPLALAKPAWWLSSTLALCLAHAGCADEVVLEDEAGAVPGTLTYYRDIKPILDAHCVPCHRDGGIGWTSFTSYPNVHQAREPIALDVARGRMPPWPATQAPYAFYQNERRLLAEERERIVHWVEQGAPAGKRKQTPRADEHASSTSAQRRLSRVDGSFALEPAYTPLAQPDEQRCFAFEWPFDAVKYLTGLSIEPGQRPMVQRGIAYLVPPGSAARTLERDVEAPGLGYPCSGVSEAGTWLTSYEPGGFGVDLPEGLGFEVQPGSVIVLQIHYNTAAVKLPDRTRLDYRVADRVERPSQLLLVENPLWLAGYLPIPAGDADVVHSVVMRPPGMSAGQRYELYAADLHMHRLGRSGSIGIVRGSDDTTPNGTDTLPQVDTVLSLPKWAYGFQETYILSQPIQVEPNDRLYVECHFDNSAENQPKVAGMRAVPRDVNWGDRADDEVCMGAVLLAPVD